MIRTTTTNVLFLSIALTFIKNYLSTTVVVVLAQDQTFNFTQIVQEEIKTIFKVVNGTDVINDECTAAITNLTQNDELISANEIFLTDLLQSCGDTTSPTCEYQDDHIILQGVRVQMDACHAQMSNQLDTLKTKCLQASNDNMFCLLSGTAHAKASEGIASTNLNINPLNCVGTCIPQANGCPNVTNTTQGTFSLDFLADFMEVELGNVVGIKFHLNDGTFDATFECYVSENGVTRRYLRHHKS